MRQRLVWLAVSLVIPTVCLVLDAGPFAWNNDDTEAKSPPPFVVSKRVPVLEDNGYYPCSDCHDNDSQKSNPRMRKLDDEHDDLAFDHGKQRFWCLACHDSENRDMLVNRGGQLIAFDESHLLCGDCHYQQQTDFMYGAHGKRLQSWTGVRQIVACAECHDVHSPNFKPREAWQPPQARTGLTATSVHQDIGGVEHE